MTLFTVLMQEAVRDDNFWAKLLGRDRVQIPADADWTITWQHMVPAWVLFLLIIPAVVAVIAVIYRRERQDVGTGPKVVLTILRSLLLILTLLLLMGPVLTVETIKKRKAFIIVMPDESRSMQKIDLLQSDKEREAVAKVTGVTNEQEIRQLSRADVVKKVLENQKLKILDELENKLNVAYFTFSSTATSRENRGKLLEEYRKEMCVG